MNFMTVSGCSLVTTMKILDLIIYSLLLSLLAIVAGHIFAGGLVMLAVNFISGVLMLSAICWAPFFYSWLRDRWIWNGGVCRKTGLPWNPTQLADGRIKLRSLHVVKHIGRWFGTEEYCR